MRQIYISIIYCSLFARAAFAAILPASLPNGVEGITYKEVQFYSNKVNLKDPSLRWKVLKTPPGITMDPKGRYAGTPTRAGSYTLSVLVYQAIGSRLDLKDSTTITHTISATTPPTINSLTPLPNGRFDMMYAPFSLTATGGIPVSTGVYTWEALPLGSNEFQNIPQGMALSKSGALSGVPTSRAPVPQSSRTYTFRARATDSVGKSATANFTLVINPALPPTILGQCPLPDGIEQIKYKDYKMTGSGGKPPYFWAIQPPQNFPAGLKFDYQTGVISGTPSTYGNFTFQINLVDKNGFSVNKSCSISILPIPHITTNSIFTCATVGKPICSEIEAVGGSKNYKWEILPPLPSNASNLTISTSTASKGLLCGNFSRSSNNTIVTVKVTDTVSSKFTTKSFTFNVRDQLNITSSCPPTEWTSGTPITPILLSANGGSGNYTWSKFDSFNKPWPKGLDLVGNKIQGTPVVSSTTNYTIAYKVADSCGNTDTKNCTVTVYPALTCNSSLGLPCLFEGMTLQEKDVFSATGGKPPYVDWELTPIGSSKALPQGLLQKKPPNGVGNGSVLYGKITENGTFNFTATVTDSLGNKCSKNHSIEVTVLKELWVVVDYKEEDGGHTCNGAAFDLTANGESIMTINLNNVTGKNDWRDNPAGSLIKNACVNGNGTDSSFANPMGIAVSNGTFYIADKENNRVRKIVASPNNSFLGPYGSLSLSQLNFGNTTAKVSTFAGNGEVGFGDGIGGAAILSAPEGVSLDGNGTVYVADTGNNRIRKITASGNVTTLAGNGTAAFGDGNGTAASFSSPSGIEVDGNGTICVADTGNNRIRKISASGNVTTIAGAGTFILPHPESSKGYSRYNRVLVDGKLLEKIKTAQTSNQIIIAATANSTLNTDSTHDPVGRLRIYTNEYSNQDLSKAKIVFDTKNATINQGIANFTSKKPAYIKLCAVLAAPTPTPAPTPALVLAVKLLSLNKKNLISQISDGVQLPVNLQDVSMKRIDIIVPDNFIDKYHLIKTSSFKIANFETTNLQYVAFLNAVAKADALNLYNSLMSNIGIKRSASNGSFSYSVGSGSENYPVTYVSWLDAARYANWLANGKPTGSSGPKTTENGAYNLASSSIVRNTINPNTGAPPTFWLLNESEWYTSAYLKSDATALWSYPTQSNSAPDPTGSKPNNLANFGGVFGETTPVGFFNQSPGPFGTFDQAGNVREWTETIDSNSGKAMRIIRGGSWADPASAMRADESQIADPSLEDDKTGFRIGGAP